MTMIGEKKSYSEKIQKVYGSEDREKRNLKDLNILETENRLVSKGKLGNK